MSESTQQPDRLLRRGEPARAEAARAIDLHDAAARWRAPDRATDEGSAASNVIVLRRGPREGGRAAPEVAGGAALRPAPAPAEARRLPRWVTLLAISAAAHLGIYLPFQHAPTPMASLGEVSVSVDIVLGADQQAGLIPDQGTSEASAPTPSQAPEAVPMERPPPAPTELAQAAPAPETPAAQSITPQPVEPQAQQPAEPALEAAPQPSVQVLAEAAAQEPPAIQTVTPVEPVAEAPPAPAPAQAAPQPQAAAPAELQVSANPTPAETTVASAAEPPPEARPTETREVAVVDPAVETPVTTVILPKETALPPERPQQRQARPAPEKPERTQARERRQQPQRAAARGERNRSETTSPASAAAGGVGRGRSDANSNYRGLVAAHLARHKRFPAEARSRGSQGSATVSFSISGSGSVTGVRLARGSGVASLDQEATAMVRRASPFPAPPGGRRMSFTVPVSFRLN